MAFAADGHLFVTESAAGDVMQLKGQRIITPADDAAGIVASQPFKSPLPAAGVRAIAVMSGRRPVVKGRF
jgi:hypothetical protein